jgi:aspartyl-tRNA(Asn)/glutamyl-tRNA(Gln) amidotransferase subunit B
VPNRKAIEAILAIGIALDCEVSPRSVFHRKNYFYADLPKNYQISQYDVPVCREGHLEITVQGETRSIGIERAHMEEDTGKSTHIGEGGRIHAASATLLDFNRSGIPLVEIVSKPDIHSALEARAYAQELRSLVLELGVSDARLEEGSMRFDANVSVRRTGSDTLGTKIEIKNMNSFRSLERAIDHEIARQISVVESGGELVQETRHWDEEAGVTHVMRTKEGSSDYRYFTEPDLVPMTFDDVSVAAVRASLPELPARRRDRYQALGLDGRQAAALSESPLRIRQVFDEAVVEQVDPVAAYNWLTGEVVSYLRRAGLDAGELDLDGRRLAELVSIVGEGLVSATAAKEVLEGVLAGEGSPREVATARDVVQVSDRVALMDAVDSVLAANPAAVENFRSGGEEKVIGFLVGQVMKQTQGKADPRLVNQLVRERLSG